MSITRGLLLPAVVCALLSPAPVRGDDCTSNLMIVLDRSCSMTQNSIMGKTRWQIAVDAINNLMAKNQGKLRYGITLFPDKKATKPQCVQTVARLAPDTGNEAKVSTALTDNTPGAPCVTNIDEGIKYAAAEPALYRQDRRSFVVLITDGSQAGCNGGPAGADPLTVQYITQMYQKKVPTYVVGFDVGASMEAQSSLNSFATAGGLPNPKGPKFYPANNQAELEAALDQLASLTTGEIGVCRGMPCPDQRCLHDGAMCVSGFCVEPRPDASATDGQPDLRSDTGEQLSTGCSCQLGPGRAATSAGSAALLLAGALLLLRRRRCRDWYLNNK
jgi:MYXO-CTERM domain-containing protein